MVKSKQFYITYYYEVIQWQIKLSIKMIKENTYPYQLEYWINRLKKSLKERKEIINKINNFQPYQPTLF